MAPLKVTVPHLLVLLLFNINIFSSGLHIGHPDHQLAAKLRSLQPNGTNFLEDISKRAYDDDVADYDNSPCPRSCAPKVNFVNTVGKRSLQDNVLLRDYNVSFLAEREMILPGSDINGFMVNEVPRAQPIVWQMPSGDDMNTSIYKPLRRVAISLGVSGLCGCTSLWIISHKGVYASHWWESISFSPEKIWKLTKSETNAAVFRRTVINPLTTGETTSSGTPKQVKLTAADLDDSSIKAYLVHPEKDCKGKIDGYKTLWDDIKKEVGNIIPSLNPDTHKDRWEEPTYTRLDRDSRDLYETPAGHVLFKYDPNHKGKKKAMLWVENRAKPLYDDEW